RNKTLFKMSNAAFALFTYSQASTDTLRWVTFENFGAIGTKLAGQIFFDAHDTNFGLNPTWNDLHIQDIEGIINNRGSNEFFLNDVFTNPSNFVVPAGW